MNKLQFFEWEEGAQGFWWEARWAVCGRLRLEIVEGGETGLSRRWSLGLMTRWDPKPTQHGLGAPTGQRAFLPQNAYLPPAMLFNSSHRAVTSSVCFPYTAQR